MSYVDPDTGFETDSAPSSEAESAVRLAMAPHLHLTGAEAKIINAYKRGVMSKEVAGQMLIALKKMIS